MEIVLTLWKSSEQRGNLLNREKIFKPYGNLLVRVKIFKILSKYFSVYRQYSELSKKILKSFKPFENFAKLLKPIEKVSAKLQKPLQDV